LDFVLGDGAEFPPEVAVAAGLFVAQVRNGVFGRVSIGLCVR
jgi:hypothetical protein